MTRINQTETSNQAVDATASRVMVLALNGVKTEGTIDVTRPVPPSRSVSSALVPTPLFHNNFGYCQRTAFRPI